MRVLVTGASGFIGGAIAARLAAAGHRVTGTVRRVDAPVPAGVDRVAWTLPAHPPASIGEQDAVVHCAALVDDAASIERALAVNRDGTAMLASAFPHAHLVHVSSSSVYDSFAHHRGTREAEADGARLAGSYARSKSHADAIARAVPGSLVVRPHAVYGRGDRTLEPRLRAAVRHGRLALPAGGSALHALTSVEHVAEVVELGVARRAAGVVNVTDAEPVRLADAVRELLGRVRIVDVPMPIARAAAAIAATGAALTGTTPRLTPYAVMQLGHDHWYALDEVERLLGWRPGQTSLSGLTRLR